MGFFKYLDMYVQSLHRVKLEMHNTFSLLTATTHTNVIRLYSLYGSCRRALIIFVCVVVVSSEYVNSVATRAVETLSSRGALLCSMLQCVAVYCSVLQEQ